MEAKENEKEGETVKDTKVLCMNEARFLLCAKLTQVKTAIVWVHHFICPL